MAVDFGGTLNLAGLAGIISAMGAFMLKVIRDERRERESMRDEHRQERHEHDMALRDALETNRREMETFLGNHLSHIPRAMDRVADRLERVEEAVRRNH